MRAGEGNSLRQSVGIVISPGEGIGDARLNMTLGRTWRVAEDDTSTESIFGFSAVCRHFLHLKMTLSSLFLHLLVLSSAA